LGQQGIHDSLELHVYVDHCAYDTPQGILALTSSANLPNEPEVNRACQDNLGKHRFVIALSDGILTAYHDKKLYHCCAAYL
jgi:hypothetical protein